MTAWSGHDRRIWDYLPGRADRRRSTVAPVIAANLGLPLHAVADSLARMSADGHVFQHRRGSWHRGLPLDPPTTIPDDQEQLWL